MQVKIALEKEAGTLLIPLYGRAMMSRAGKLIRDTYAEDAVEKLDFDFASLKIPEKLNVFMSLRGVLLDGYTKYFLEENPDCLVLHLGCGLDSRFFRVDNSRVRWYDLDFPEVVEIKQRLYGESPRYTMISSSVTDYNWISQIDEKDLPKPTLILAEGLLMYLDRDEVSALIRKLRDAFAPAVFIFDAYSKLTAKYAGRQISLKSTGARVRWGVDDPCEIEGFGEGINHMETRYFADADLSSLGAYYRFMFDITRNVKAAKEAHRIFKFVLERGRDACG